jgi:hypothetical protein
MWSGSGRRGRAEDVLLETVYTIKASGLEYLLRPGAKKPETS